MYILDALDSDFHILIMFALPLFKNARSKKTRFCAVYFES